jgi:hypothetical protein
MPVIITITNEPTTVDSNGLSYIYNYSEYDRILKNVCKNEYEVFYSGQNQGIFDYQLTNAIENNDIFKVYYRPKKSMSYTYLGYTNNINIIQYRILPLNVNTNTNQRLQIHLIINNITNSLVPINNFTGSGKFKKDILVHSGLRDINDNSIIQHNRNTNLGFYYY